jgi:hypothetical protein
MTRSAQKAVRAKPTGVRLVAKKESKERFGWSPPPKAFLLAVALGLSPLAKANKGTSRFGPLSDELGSVMRTTPALTSYFVAVSRVILKKIHNLQV